MKTLSVRVHLRSGENFLVKIEEEKYHLLVKQLVIVMGGEYTEDKAKQYTQFVGYDGDVDYDPVFLKDIMFFECIHDET